MQGERVNTDTITTVLERATPTRRRTRSARTGGVAIDVQGLSVNYGQKNVLRDVTLEIPRTQITAFIGPSGCGKSTALRCFNRMNDEIPTFSQAGSIMIDGIDVRDRAVDVTSLRREVGMVFQQPNPFPMSIYENIALAVREHRGRVARDEMDAIVERALTDANLWDEVKNELGKVALALSGGQQQRLCIARALAVKPSVLMLDEPCASLDPISTARIEELLLKLVDDYTIIIVTHNLAQAQRISDDVAFFLMGDLVEFGPADEIFKAPQRKETAQYVRGA
ncbi:MAG: phosphate ABC transporter ATP-binding protein, partial [Actinobacteria bacterium]